MSQRVGASVAGSRRRHLSLDKTDVPRVPFTGYHPLRPLHPSTRRSRRSSTLINTTPDALTRSSTTAVGQDPRRFVIATKDNGATWSPPIDVTGALTGSGIRKRILYMMHVRDMEHNTTQIFQAQAPTFELIGPPVSDGELYSLVNSGGSCSVIRIVIIGPLKQQFPFPLLASVETSGAKLDLPLQEPLSPDSSTGYDASDEDLMNNKKGTRVRRAQETHSIGNSPLRHSPPPQTIFSTEETPASSTINPSVHFQQPYLSPKSNISRARSHQNLLNEPAFPPTSRDDEASQTNPSRRDTGAHPATRSPDDESGQRPFISLRQHLKRHAHTHQTLRAFLLSSIDESPSGFRARTAKLGAEELGVLTSILQNCISQCGLNEEQSHALKLLQDITLSSMQFPQSYWITGVVRGFRIAAGGEATTYDGTYRGCPVVIRLYHPPKANGWEDQDGQSVLKLVIRESVVHRQLHHKNIVRFVGIFQNPGDGIPSIVLQKACYGSVHAYLRQWETPFAFLKIVKGMIAALCYLHSRAPPIIHGDVHDDNILVDESGEALICDFGLCRVRYEVSRTHTEIRQGGRVRFVAPESWSSQRPHRINEASDTYSLAMTIYALGTRLRPFSEYNHDFAVVNVVQSGTRPTQPESLGGLPPCETAELWKIMSSMWAQDPHRRPSMHLVKARFHMLFSTSDVP